MPITKGQELDTFLGLEARLKVSIVALPFN